MAAGNYDERKTGSGQADLEREPLGFSVESIELSVSKGEITEGFFTVYAPGEVPAEGRVYTSELKMQPLTREFIGKK